MNIQPGLRKIGTTILAVILWLATIGLGLEALYTSSSLSSLLFVALGGDADAAGLFTPWLVFVLGVIFLVFIIWSTEFHRKRIGQPVSWRVFAWSLAVEASVVLLFYLL